MRNRIAALWTVALIAAACASEPGGLTAETTAVTASPTTSSRLAASTTDAASPAPAPVQIDEAVPLRGFALSPRSNSAADLQNFLDLAAEGGTLLEWVGDGFEWGSEAGTPDVTVALAESINVEPITIGGWARTEDGSLIRPLTEDNVASYVEAARSFATRHRPALIGFGVEIDTHWRGFPE